MIFFYSFKIFFLFLFKIKEYASIIHSDGYLWSLSILIYAMTCMCRLTGQTRLGFSLYNNLFTLVFPSLSLSQCVTCKQPGTYFIQNIYPTFSTYLVVSIYISRSNKFYLLIRQVFVTSNLFLIDSHISTVALFPRLTFSRSQYRTWV